jgi:hypothetical protein
MRFVSLSKKLFQYTEMQQPWCTSAATTVIGRRSLTTTVVAIGYAYLCLQRPRRQPVIFARECRGTFFTGADKCSRSQNYGDDELFSCIRATCVSNAGDTRSELLTAKIGRQLLAVTSPDSIPLQSLLRLFLAEGPIAPTSRVHAGSFFAIFPLALG